MIQIISIIGLVLIVILFKFTDICRHPEIMNKVNEEEMKTIMNANYKLLCSMMYNRMDEQLSNFYLEKLNQNVKDIWKTRNQK